MKLKLDENIGQRGKALLIEAGHDAVTVLEQNLSGASDPEVIAVCQSEQRCLATLDLDFSNPLRFQPSQYSGIAVLRLPSPPAHQDLLDAILTFIGALKTDDITGKLWIIQRGTIRIYQEGN
jgi:predicted nuclease of predicted toxin-antitoxin system